MATPVAIPEKVLATTSTPPKPKKARKRKSYAPTIHEAQRVARDDIPHQRIMWPDNVTNLVSWTLNKSGGRVAVFPLTAETLRMVGAIRGRLEERLSLRTYTILSGTYRNHIAVWIRKR